MTHYPNGNNFIDGPMSYIRVWPSRTWFNFSQPDYWYWGRSYLIDAGAGSRFNRGWSQGFGIIVLHVRWKR